MGRGSGTHAAPVGAPVGRRPFWTDETVEAALLAWMHDHDGRFPGADELTDAGLGAVRRAVSAHGGFRLWAARMLGGPPDRHGHRPVRSSGRPPRWTEDTVRAGLLTWIAQHGHFPSSVELNGDGQHALRRGVQVCGGFQYWRAQLEAHPPVAPGPPPAPE